MAVHQPAIRQHLVPGWVEVLGAAILGAILLFSFLLIAGHPDLLPALTGAQVTTQTDASAIGRATALQAQARAEQERAVARTHMQRGSSMAAQARAEAARLGAIGSTVRAQALEAQAWAEYRVLATRGPGR